MKKIHITICTLLVLCLLLFSSLQSVLAITVGAAVFCPNNYIPPPQGFDTEYEIQLSTAYCTAIHSMLNSKYGGLCYLKINATRSQYTSTLSYLKSACDQIVVFSKGHRGIEYGTPFDHITLLDHNGINNVIDDQHIYPNTDSSKNNVTFIWHCETSEYYPPPSPWKYGMPYCWTHDYTMQPYVTYGNHVYLGWVNQSPQFETAVNAQYKFAEVACWFWYNTCDGDSVLAALNNLAFRIWGEPYFTDTELMYETAYHGPLKPYGNMGFYLPEE
jgi:hypothetical protein